MRLLKMSLEDIKSLLFQEYEDQIASILARYGSLTADQIFSGVLDYRKKFYKVGKGGARWPWLWLCWMINRPYRWVFNVALERLLRAEKIDEGKHIVPEIINFRRRQRNRSRMAERITYSLNKLRKAG